MMANRTIHVVSIIVFSVLLSVPLLWHVFGSGEKNHENRVMAAWPDWPKSWAEIKPSQDQLENYLADHFGLRTRFIQLTNRIRYQLFKEATSPQITIGKDGYIYLNSHNKDTPNSLIKGLCAQVVPDVSIRSRIKQGVEEFLSYFRQQKIQVLVAVVPTKSRIYPEFLPDQEKSWCLSARTNWIDQLMDQFKVGDVLYPLAQFKQWKQQFPVYLSKYFHWHGITPSRVADLIFSQWKIPAEPERSQHSLVVSSDLSSHLRGVSLLDNSTHYSYKGVLTCHGADCIEGFAEKYKNGTVKMYDKGFLSDRRLLILSDSFGPHITQHFSRGFDQVYSVDLNHLQNNEEVEFFRWMVGKTKPTHMLYLIHDGGLVWQSLRLERVMAELNQLNKRD